MHNIGVYRQPRDDDERVEAQKVCGPSNCEDQWWGQFQNIRQVFRNCTPIQNMVKLKLVFDVSARTQIINDMDRKKMLLTGNIGIDGWCTDRANTPYGSFRLRIFPLSWIFRCADDPNHQKHNSGHLTLLCVNFSKQIVWFFDPTDCARRRSANPASLGGRCQHPHVLVFPDLWQVAKEHFNYGFRFDVIRHDIDECKFTQQH